MESVVEGSKAFETFNDQFEKFADGIKTETDPEGRSLAGIEKELNEHLALWGAKFKLKLRAPSTAEIIKSLLNPELFDGDNPKALTADQFGSGFQRYFIYSLIQIGSRYVGKKPSRKVKDFTPSMTLILFEEPEAFLHPPQQEILALNLMKLGADCQVLCSTHSSHFVSKNANNIPSLIRLKRVAGTVEAHQISNDAWNKIVDANQAINEIASQYKNMAKKLREDDKKPEMEAVKHFLWLNPDRCGMFFADHVLLVEGASEAALINKMIGDGKIHIDHCGLYVLDCLGKYNIHRFMNLLSYLGIPYSVIHDDDDNKDLDFCGRYLNNRRGGAYHSLI